jgi:hypothetical protein
MKELKGLFLIISFVIEFIIAFMAVFFLDPGSDYFLPAVIIGLAAGMVFIFLSVSEVVTSERIKAYERLIWVLFLIFLSNLSGIVYLLIRKRSII